MKPARSQKRQQGLEDIPLVRVNNLPVRWMRRIHLSPLLALRRALIQTLRHWQIHGIWALQMGSEGVPTPLTREACDVMAAINMADTSESLNVSVAAAIALYATRFQE